MKDNVSLGDKRFEFKIDGEQLYAPRESMTVQELIDIALQQKVLDPVPGGYALEDDKGNAYGPDKSIDLGKINVFYATENAPGPASCCSLSPSRGDA